MLERQYVVASFLHKLWSMLEDSTNSSVISWSEDGSSFIVHDQARFSMEVLPKFYKHNNMASFIRQLNMYGFSKISHDPSHNALHAVKNAESTSVEFQHPQFIRGQPDLVASIKRKAATVATAQATNQQIATPQTFPTQNLQNDPMAIKVLSEVQQLHKKHDSFNNQLEQLRHENEVLWREMASLRQKCHNQQTIISKVVNFLVSVIGGNNGSGLNAVGGGAKRSFPMIEADHSRQNDVQSSSRTDSSPAKVSKLYDYQNTNNGSSTGVTIQEIVEDESSIEPILHNSPADFMVNVLGAGGLSSHEFQEPIAEPPVKIVPLPSVANVQPGPSSSVNVQSSASSSYDPQNMSLFSNTDDFNHHLDNVQIDLDQLRTNLRSYFADNSPEGEAPGHFNEDFLSDLFSPDQPPLLGLESPLPSPDTLLGTPVGVTSLEEEVNSSPVKNATQLVKYLPPNYYLTGSADPLLYSQPSTSGTPPMIPKPNNPTGQAD